MLHQDVVRVIVAADIPGKNLLFGSMVGSGEPLLLNVGDHVEMAGQILCIVLARTQVLQAITHPFNYHLLSFYSLCQGCVKGVSRVCLSPEFQP